jgi:DNA-binding CsgD family transcriptional regulator
MHLSAGDIAALEHASTVLLSPFAFEDAMAWRRASCRAVEACVGADGSSHVLPLASEPQIAASADIERALAAIFPPPPWIIEALTVRRRAQSLTVADWEELFDISIVRGAPFYNDVVRPQHLLAPISMLADIGHGLLPGTISVYFENERTARAHVRRRKQLMRLLFPAFRAGMDTFLRFRRNLASLTALTEGAGIGVVTFTPSERVGRENDHFRALMSNEPERERVRSEVKRAARGAIDLGTLGDRGSHSRRANSEVRTSAGRYRIAAAPFGGESAGEPMVSVALVERRADRPLGARELSSRFSLTRREIEAALLLRHGLPTRKIAVELGVSVNTARRHVDKILLKLDVSNRTAAAAKIFGR